MVNQKTPKLFHLEISSFQNAFKLCSWRNKSMLIVTVLNYNSNIIFKIKNPQKISTYHIEVSKRYNSLEFISLFAVNNSFQDQLYRRWYILLKQFVQFLLFVLVGPGVHPLLPEWYITQVLGVDKHHTASWYCGWRSVLKIWYLGIG